MPVSPPVGATRAYRFPAFRVDQGAAFVHLDDEAEVLELVYYSLGNRQLPAGWALDRGELEEQPEHVRRGGRRHVVMLAAGRR